MNHSEIKAAFPNHYIFASKKAGNAKELKGNVVIQLFFVEDLSNTWTAEEKLKFRIKHNSAMNTLTKAASTYGTKLNITTEIYSRKIYSDCLKSNKSKWVNDIFRNLNIPNISDFQNGYKRLYKCDEAPVVFVRNLTATSYAYSASVSDLPKDEFSVIDSYDTEKIIIHELLHQFGAEDLYLPDGAFAAAKKYLPNTVMQNGSEIDPLTAYLIGWTDNLPECAVSFLKETNHYTLDDCIQARIARLMPSKKASSHKKNPPYPKRYDGIPQ